VSCSTQLVKKIGSVLYVQEHFPQITPAMNIYTAYLYDNKEVHILSSANKKKIQVSLLFFFYHFSESKDKKIQSILFVQSSVKCLFRRKK
jgi:hypothetical protein